MAEDFAGDDDNRYMKHAESRTTFAHYLNQIQQFAHPETVPEGFVLSYHYFLQHDSGALIGGIRFRPELNDQTVIEGGNIGYDVRPLYRGQGYATAMLQMVLEMAREHGLNRALLTCFTDNPASERVIRKCGGGLESIEPSPRNGKPTKRFWIEL